MLRQTVEWFGYLCKVTNETPMVTGNSQESLHSQVDKGMSQVVTFSILVGSAATPSSEISWPRYCTFGQRKPHFEDFSFIPESQTH